MDAVVDLNSERIRGRFRAMSDEDLVGCLLAAYKYVQLRATGKARAMADGGALQEWDDALAEEDAARGVPSDA